MEPSSSYVFAVHRGFVSKWFDMIKDLHGDMFLSISHVLWIFLSQFANGHLCHLLKVYNNRILEYHDLFSSEVPDRPTLLRSVFLWVMAALWDVLCGTRWDSRVPTGELERHQTSDLTYTPINWHSNGKWTPLKMYFLLKMGIFQPAMLICQRVLDIFVSFFGGFCYCVRCVFSHKEVCADTDFVSAAQMQLG